MFFAFLFISTEFRSNGTIKSSEERYEKHVKKSIDGPRIVNIVPQKQ